MCFKNFRPEEKKTERYIVRLFNPEEENITFVCCGGDLTLVRDPCAAEVKFNQLIAADQTSPHDCVSHLSAG